MINYSKFKTGILHPVRAVRYLSNKDFFRKCESLFVFKKIKFESKQVEIYQDPSIQKDNFSYEKYKKIQEKGNKQKIDTIFEIEDNIKMLSDYLMKNISDIKFGLCHGTRRGKEQEWFRKYLKAEVMGTEISETANKFPYTIEWDFHKVKDEWIEKVDFIYSNSLDHSYDPKHCLKQWFRCLRKGGICIINFTTYNMPQHASELDPSGFTKKGLTLLINEIAKESNVLLENYLDGKKNSNLKNCKNWGYYIIRKYEEETV